MVLVSAQPRSRTSTAMCRDWNEKQWCRQQDWGGRGRRWCKEKMIQRHLLKHHKENITQAIVVVLRQ